MVEGHPRNNPVKLFQSPSTGSGEEVGKRFFYFSSGGHLAQRSETV